MIQRMSRNGLIGSGICLSAVILSWAEASGADATTVNAPQQIMIEIRNQTETDLRCVMVLAHFVTQDVPIVRAGETTADFVVPPDAAKRDRVSHARRSADAGREPAVWPSGQLAIH